MAHLTGIKEGTSFEQLFIAWPTDRIGGSVRRVKLLGIIKEDLIRQLPRNIFPRPHGGHQLALFGGILMTVVRTDEQMIPSGELNNVINVLVCFAGDKNPVLPEHVLI